MSDPKMAKSSLSVSYKSTDGYSGKATFSGASSSGPLGAEKAMLEAVDEISRVLALFSLPREKVMEQVNEAYERVAAHRAKREASNAK